ncbi:hypothetical protein ACM8AX_01385 [Pseudomonas aeruginosa]
MSIQVTRRRLVMQVVED